jgi:hypothetical protein
MEPELEQESNGHMRTILISAVALVATMGCTTTQQRPDAQASTATAIRPCAMDTGSRLPMKPGDCSIAPGRSYSQDDLRRTGEDDVGEALKLLDPSITVHH